MISYFSETQAKQYILQAGKQLIEAGLVARTWGNISARISSTQMLITPSGRAYETLTPDQIVLVNIADCSYEGTIKPSSEKGIHAGVYLLRPEAKFIIHTHQTKASVYSVGQEILSGFDAIDQKILGDNVPCVPYGISATKRLRQEVLECVEKNPHSNAFLMCSHGALCIGRNRADAFLVSSTLERICQKAIERRVSAQTGKPVFEENDRRKGYLLKAKSGSQMPDDIPDLGNSERQKERVVLMYNNQQIEFDMNAKQSDLPAVSLLHLKIYKTQNVTHIMHLQDLDVIAVSCARKTMIPALDDLAQIAGVSVHNLPFDLAYRGLHKRNAVLVHQSGALCTGNSLDEASAVGLVLKKACEAEIYASYVQKPHILGLLDRWIQRTFYVMKYSKLKK
jgi:L-fuculose-phosphate aldolase